MEIKSIELIKNERIRQITEEGYSWRLDDQYFIYDRDYTKK